MRGRLGVGLVIPARPDFSLVNVDDKGCTALDRAAADGFHDVVNAILNHPDLAEVNAVNNFRLTALQFVASNGHYLVCQPLAQRPATCLDYRRRLASNHRLPSFVSGSILGGMTFAGQSHVTPCLCGSGLGSSLGSRCQPSCA